MDTNIQIRHFCQYAGTKPPDQRAGLRKNKTLLRLPGAVPPGGEREIVCLRLTQK